MFYNIYKTIRLLTAPIKEISELVPFDSKVLDLGCGRGVLADEIIKNKNPAGYTGVDINENNIRRLKKRYPLFRFIQSDAIDFVRECNKKGEKFDTIIISDLLYLFEDEMKEELIRSSYQILLDGGTMIIKDAGHNLMLFVQEYISVRILRLNVGRDIRLRSIDFYEKCLSGIKANYVIINARRLWYPHFIIVVKK